jgi:hypothetical protein
LKSKYSLLSKDFHLGVRHAMRFGSSFILMLAVLLGLHARVLAKVPCEVIVSTHQADHCDHHHEESPPCDSPHEKDCPAEHHHHCGLGCHVSPLVTEENFASLLLVPAFSRMRLRSESELIPEDPDLSSDRPPII